MTQDFVLGYFQSRLPALKLSALRTSHSGFTMNPMATNFEITCPCCESLIVIDRNSGEVLLHKEKQRAAKASLEDMVSNLERQKQEAAKKFEKTLESQKDRGRILEERFKEAMARADKSDTPMKNPMDLD